jgi:RND family efflux transporter MFP subunit
MMSRRFLRHTLVLGVLAAVLAAGCHDQAPEKKKKVEVIVTTPITDEVTDYQDFTGRLSALKSVDIRARVSGYVKQAPFKEGDVVHQGDLLFEIDETVYAAALEKAEADVALFEAQKRLLDAQYARNRQLVGQGAVSRDDFETTMAQRDQAVANIASSKAMVKTARQNLDWTRVTAPHTGRVSRRLVDPGNLVNADNTILTTLVTEDPMYVYFDVDERTFEDLVGSASPGMHSWLMGLQFPLLMRLANENEFTHAGTVNFIDNQVNPTTGTIRMRGVFPNPQGALKPGMFARVRLPLGSPYRALLVPGEALQSDQGRKYVYVVDADNKVAYRKVTPGQAIGSLRVVKDGLAEGDRVIVSGMQRVRAGAQADEVRMQPPPPRPESPLGKLLTLDRHAGAGPRGGGAGAP